MDAETDNCVSNRQVIGSEAIVNCIATSEPGCLSPQLTWEEAWGALALARIAQHGVQLGDLPALNAAVGQHQLDVTGLVVVFVSAHH